MTRDDRLLIVLLAIVVAAIALGEVYVYGNMSHFDSDVSEDGTYTLSDNGADSYDVVAIDRNGFPAIERATILLDEGYGSVAKVSFVEIGAPSLDQRTYVDRLGKNLDLLGFEGHAAADARSLRDVLKGQISSGTCPGSSVAVVSGALPDTVYDGTSSSLIIEWIAAGGSLYFVGGPLGFYIGHEDGTVSEVGPSGQSLFLGTDAHLAEKKKARSAVSEDWRAALLLRSVDLQFAPYVGSPDAKAYGYTDGVYSTISMFKHGLGQVCVVAGGHTDAQRQDLATAIATSVSYCSELLDHNHGQIVRETVSGKLDVSDGADLTAYVTFGGFFTTYGKSYVF